MLVKKELINTALYNRKHLINSAIIPDIQGNKRLKLTINGVGKKTIKLTAYVNYDNILKFHEETGSIEQELYELINKVY